MAEAFDSYKLHTALKQHFTTKKYDFFKYRGKSYADKHAKQFDQRPDRFFFYKVWSRYKNDLKDFYVSVFSSGDDPWVGDLLDGKYDSQYNEWLKRKQSIRKIFSDDVDTLIEFLIEYNLEFKNLLVPNGTKMPKIIQLEEQKYISQETVVIINQLTHFVDKVECQHPFWNDKQLLLTKYQPFVGVSKLGWFASTLKDGIDKLGLMPKNIKIN